MKKYVVIYHAPAQYMQMMSDMGATQEDMQAQMQAWMEWMGRCGDGLVEKGGPLVLSAKVTGEGSSPSDKKVVGYSILQAEDMAGAQAMLEGHPHLGLADECEIEIHEEMQMPG